MSSFFPPYAIKQVANYFYKVDEQVRLDLSIGRVVGERDYLSRFISLLEYPYGINGVGRLSFQHMYIANNFPGASEQQFGCDTFFLFRYNNRVKILAIEGKYPRFQLRNYPWDQKQKKGKRSHFTTQLHRQAQLEQLGIPVLEMFMENELPNPRRKHPFNFDGRGSSFVSYNIARHYRISNATWKHTDAQTIINQQYSATLAVNIDYFISELVQCRLGNKHRIDLRSESIKINIRNKQPLEIPVTDLSRTDKDPEFGKRVADFMKDKGIRNFGFIHYIDSKQ